MIELYWGLPLFLKTSADAGTKKISTIEHAQYLLASQWPVDDQARANALQAIDEAMDCMGSVGTARLAFAHAAHTAGFTSVYSQV